MPYNIGVANLSHTWCSTWQWSDLPVGKDDDEVKTRCNLRREHKSSIVLKFSFINLDNDLQYDDGIHPN